MLVPLIIRVMGKGFVDNLCSLRSNLWNRLFELQVNGKSIGIQPQLLAFLVRVNVLLGKLFVTLKSLLGGDMSFLVCFGDCLSSFSNRNDVRLVFRPFLNGDVEQLAKIEHFDGIRDVALLEHGKFLGAKFADSSRQFQRSASGMCT